MRHGVIEKKSPEKLAKSLEKLEAFFQKRKQELAYAAYEMKQVGAATETPKTEFNFIHSEVIPDRKSKFQAHIAQVTSLEQVEQALAQLKTDSKIAKATYNMVAYRIYVKEKKSYLEEGRDDGENEAGRRLLHLLQISKVEDAVVIVTRWHGGVHIGPDRFKHINECANEVIKIATEKGMIATTAVGSSELSGTKKKSKGKGKK
ncbi:protein IMPACT [Exaiptasia diaphana]|uniref:Impact N-terminal domain-containing protein n=1 Tax=Exaiptasia diaphana TaxID=2652724 RepID=A0A913X3M4_EXADI|nr:protein IMPACT [Exaiptasia diaphana]